MRLCFAGYNCASSPLSLTGCSLLSCPTEHPVAVRDGVAGHSGGKSRAVLVCVFGIVGGGGGEKKVHSFHYKLAKSGSFTRHYMMLFTPRGGVCMDKRKKIRSGTFTAPHPSSQQELHPTKITTATQ